MWVSNIYWKIGLREVIHLYLFPFKNNTKNVKKHLLFRKMRHFMPGMQINPCRGGYLSLLAVADVFLRTSGGWSDTALDFHEVESRRVERYYVDLEMAAPPVPVKYSVTVSQQVSAGDVLAPSAYFHP